MNDAACPQLQKELQEIEGILAGVSKMWDSQIFQIKNLSLGDSKARRKESFLIFGALSPGHHKAISKGFLLGYAFELPGLI